MRQMRSTGIDVSEFQGNIDWKAVADSGIDFAMIRVGYRGMKNGEIKEDACAKYNLQEASKNGLKIGAYFFSTAVTEEEAKEEAEWTKNLLSGYPVTYPVAYNCEGFQNPSSRQFDLSVEERTKLADAFLKSIEEGSYTGMFYAARNELDDNNLWNADDLSLNYRIWVAQYSDQTWPEKTKSDYTGDHVMWQYTNQGKMDGIKGAVDFNVAYFGYSQSQQAVDENGAEQVEANVEVESILQKWKSR
ncbi:MAG: GH25 family lysozyme [[Clostridium] nexile]